jgi:glycosyltransferase involved in cell wall biosynthesis
MATGLPVVAPGFAEGVARIVRATGCGVLCDPTSPLAIAEAVRALADPACRQAMGEKGRAAAEGEWGWPAEAARLVALYRGLMPAA